MKIVHGQARANSRRLAERAGRQTGHQQAPTKTLQSSTRPA